MGSAIMAAVCSKHALAVAPSRPFQTAGRIVLAGEGWLTRGMRPRPPAAVVIFDVIHRHVHSNHKGRVLSWGRGGSVIQRGAASAGCVAPGEP
jgi:hypothetical protein